MSLCTRLSRPCAFGCRRWQTSALLSRPHRQSYATLRLSSPTRRKWRDLALSLLTGFAIITAWKPYSSDRYNQDRLNPATFSEYILVEKQSVSKTSSIFNLYPIVRSADPASVYQQAWERGIWSVEFKQPQLQIARAYTPLPPTLRPIPETKEDLRFLIRRDPEGEVSSYLHQLPEVASIDIRGPNLQYEIPPTARKVLFLAGGTGIAPALQAAYCLLEAREKSEETRINILWASRGREDCSGGVSDCLPAPQKSWWKPLFGRGISSLSPANEIKIVGQESYIVKELEALKAKHPSQVTVEYFVDEEGSFITETALQKYIAEMDQRYHVILSGPDGFISSLAGPKVWSNGREAQGPLGGVLQHLGLKSSDVWKL